MSRIFRWNIIELNFELFVVSDTAIHSKDKVISLLENVYGGECKYKWLKWIPQYRFGYVKEYGFGD